MTPDPGTPDLDGRLIDLLEDAARDCDGWSEVTGQLEQQYGTETYRHLLFLLTHLDFPGEKAKAQWLRALDTWRELAAATGADIDLRVAVLHYFLKVHKQLKNPAVVELKILLEARDSAMTDELTQLYNYRYFMDRIQHEIRRTNREASSLSLLMLDLDDFKLFNDRHGHLRGNVALQRTAEVFKACTREVDVVARYGGEEFAVILPATTKDGAITVAEHVRRRLAETAMTGHDDVVARLTVSIGIATAPTDAAVVEELLERADAALYRAKSLGKNRVHVYSDERRAFARFATAIPGEVRLLDEDTLPVTTTNISRGGALLYSSKPVAVGGTLQLELDLPETDERFTCIARVVRVIELPHGYEVGVRIIDLEGIQAHRLRAYLERLND